MILARNLQIPDILQAMLNLYRITICKAFKQVPIKKIHLGYVLIQSANIRPLSRKFPRQEKVASAFYVMVKREIEYNDSVTPDIENRIKNKLMF